jgi:phage terminase Nu1 subunit (DNA packaging protein)
MVQKLLKRDLARELGVSASLVSRYERKGMPVNDAGAARAWLDSHLIPGLRKEARQAKAIEAPPSSQKTTANLPPPQGVTGDRGNWIDHKSRRELAEAQLAELELREKTAELVQRDVVARETFTLFRTLRDRILGIPDRIAAIIAAESDTAKVHALLTAELRSVLTDTAGGLA